MKHSALPAPNRNATAADRFRAFAARASEKLGSPWAFFAAVGLIILWLVTGPIFKFSNAW